ncbi:hypothetical protein BG015_005779 [Linnemannia schmuckeri]|uniref:SAP domain-containing protein n=1 Tax=Linnemannia schmuckeri TaxID=64567 RepID=A0A9P5VC88_9FUNG|nr:hypothetical protein BG015_005779 [Linnemannia schmuckeri]
MDPRKLKVNELKEQLQLAGLSVNGKKEELVARLLEHQKAEEEVALAAGPPTGTGESFNWEDPIDDLAPPAADASTKSTSAAATTPAAKAPATKATTTATATAATPTTNAAKPESTTTESSVQFQGATASDNDALKAEIEKRKSRAARFGTALTEQDKALERAARFGVPVAATTTASLAKAAGTAVAPATTATKAVTTGAAKSDVPSKPSSIASQIPADLLSKRQARFGIVEPAVKASSTPVKPVGTTAPAAGGVKRSGLVLDAAEEEKKRKRAAKFGLPSAEDDASKKAKV